MGVRWPLPVLLVSASLLGASPAAAAEPSAACRARAGAEDALTDLAKEAFLNGVQEAGIALGEKGLRLAESGRGTAGARLVERGERAFFGAELAGAVDDLIVDPVKAYFESPAEEAADRAFGKLLEGCGKLVFPTAGIALDGGRFLIGTATWTVEEMYDAGRRQQIEATLFGRGADVALGSINNLLSQDPFFDSGPVRNRRISRESVGREVRSEAALRELWFTHYRNFLLGGPMGLTPSSREEVQTALAEGWPHLKRYWSFKRAEMVVREMRSAFGAQMRATHSQIQGGDCDQQAAPAASSAAPSKWAGTWKDDRFGITLVLTDSGAALTGKSTSGSKSQGAWGEATWQCGPAGGDTRQCTWQGRWVDSTKDVTESGTADLELGSGSLTVSTRKTSVNVKPAPGWDWSRDPQWNPGSLGVYRFRRGN